MRSCVRFKIASCTSWESRSCPAGPQNLLRLKIVSNNPENFRRHAINQLRLEAGSFCSLYSSSLQRFRAKGRLGGNNLAGLIQKNPYLHLTTDVILLGLSRINGFWQISRQIVENTEIAGCQVVLVSARTRISIGRHIRWTRLRDGRLGWCAWSGSRFR